MPSTLAGAAFDGLGKHIAARHPERAALITGVGSHHHHVGDLLGRFQGHGALFFRRNVETAELQSGGAFADAELRSALGNKVEHCDRLRSAGGVIVVGNHLANAWPSLMRWVRAAAAARNKSDAAQWEYSSRKWCSTAQA